MNIKKKLKWDEGVLSLLILKTGQDWKFDPKDRFMFGF